MNTQLMNQSWRSTNNGCTTNVVLPTFGFGMGEVRLDAFGYVSAGSVVSTDKRHAAAAIKVTPATGYQPWSPPVT